MILLVTGIAMAGGIGVLGRSVLHELRIRRVQRAPPSTRPLVSWCSTARTRREDEVARRSRP